MLLNPSFRTYKSSKTQNHMLEEKNKEKPIMHYITQPIIQDSSSQGLHYLKMGQVHRKGAEALSLELKLNHFFSFDNIIFGNDLKIHSLIKIGENAVRNQFLKQIDLVLLMTPFDSIKDRNTLSAERNKKIVSFAKMMSQCRGLRRVSLDISRAAKSIIFTQYRPFTIYKFDYLIDLTTLRALNQNLSKLNNLERISLQFKVQKEISVYKIISSLSKDFQGLFTKLRIEFTLNPDYGLYKFIGLKETNSINIKPEVEFIYNGYSPSGDTFEDFIHQLRRSLSLFPNISKMSLSFEECRNLNDERLNYLLNPLEKSQHISNLQIDLSKCRQITQNSIKVFKERLSKLPNLRILNLYFASCSGIEHMSMDSLSEMLAPLRNLQHLELNFNYLAKIIALPELSKALSKFDYLTTIFIKFEECKEIAEEDAKAFIMNLKPNKGLKCLKLSFKGCKKITTELRFFVRKHPALLSTVQHFGITQ